MIVIPPVDIYSNHNRLISSSIVEGTETDPSSIWNSTTAYLLGDRVYIEENFDTPGKIYEALVNVTGGTIPSTDVLAVTPKWIEVGPTNKWAMFDLLRDTVSTVTNNDITIVLEPGSRIDSLALLNMTGINFIQVTGINSEGEVIYPTNSMLNPGKSYIITNLPQTIYLRLTIVLSGDTVLSIGSVAVGKFRYIGEVQRGVSLDTLNFSEVSRDIYGNANMVPRRNVPKITKKLFVLADYVANILETRDLLNAIPAIWVGMENNEIPDYYESLLIVGFYRVFTITLDSHLSATVSLELEEI